VVSENPINPVTPEPPVTPPTPKYEPDYHFDTDTYGIKEVGTDNFIQTGFNREEFAAKAADALNNPVSAPQNTTNVNVVSENPINPVTPETPKLSKNIIFYITFWGCLIGGFVWFSQYNNKTNNPTEEELKVEELAKELEHEKIFLQDRDNKIKDGKELPTLIRIETPDGNSVTGKWLFITECPKGFLCAQPDGALKDENGFDWNSNELPDPPDPEY